MSSLHVMLGYWCTLKRSSPSVKHLSGSFPPLIPATTCSTLTPTTTTCSCWPGREGMPRTGRQARRGWHHSRKREFIWRCHQRIGCHSQQCQENLLRSKKQLLCQ